VIGYDGEQLMDLNGYSPGFGQSVLRQTFTGDVLKTVLQES